MGLPGTRSLCAIDLLYQYTDVLGMRLWSPLRDLSQLWCRGNDNYMAPVYKPALGVPRDILSWSWMAYTGKIDFVDAPFGRTDWTGDVESPLLNTEEDPGYQGLPAMAREILESAWKSLRSTWMFDRGMHEGGSDGSVNGLMCVVVGK
jgi:hypothetical protein